MTMGCIGFREVAPEVALGIAEGDERSAALAHLATCADCRQDLEGLTGAVDAVTATARSVEPPSGFEVRTLAAFDAAPAQAAGPRGRRVLAAAAAIVAVVALLGVGLSVLLDDDRPGSSELARADSATSLTAPDGSSVGTVRLERTTADDGSTRAELVVSVGGGAPQGTYRVECDYGSGRPYGAGQLAVGPDGVTRWSTTIGVSTYDLRRVRLVSTDGTANLEAEFR